MGIGAISAFCWCGDDPIGFINYGNFSSLLGLASKAPLDSLFFFIGMSNVAIWELVGKAPFDGRAPVVITTAVASGGANSY